MTKLFPGPLPIPSVRMGGENTLPLLYDIRRPGEAQDSCLPEDAELFLGYGGSKSAFPYKAQDRYGRELTEPGPQAVTLENDHLRAVFVPSLGGKLWSLFDKDMGRELLFSNHVVRPAYLALRNAWLSGGVEWNCGAVIGHHPHTCSPMFTALISREESGLGCPVLRMYHFERIRAVVQQMDFWLPEDSRFLHCRMRVVNDARTATAMYWWSNIAVPSCEEARCVVPADGAFTPVAGKICRVPVPFYNGVDVSYPTRNPIAVDYFFDTYRNHRPYTSHLDGSGYGLVQTSTARLKGRKLFVWGRGQGGAKWQEYLSGDDGRGNYSDGRYCEIQCGLANSQYECLPMPPKTAWEWMEYYGPMKADPKKIHGSWQEAQQELESALDALLPVEAMEQELKATHTMATSPLGKMLCFGDGWAALENIRREKADMPPLCPHLNFGTTDWEQEPWLALLETGSLRDPRWENAGIPPRSYQRRPEWQKLMKAAAAGADRDYWLTHYLLACAWLSEGDEDRAEICLERSLSLDRNAWNLYVRAELLRIRGDLTGSAEVCLEAFRLAPEDESLCTRTAALLEKAGLWQELADFTEGLNPSQKRLPRIRLYLAISAEKRGDPDLAEAILMENGGLEIPDIQEGEISITELWFNIEAQKAAREGRPFDRSTAKPPKKFDFRMNVSDA